MNQTHQGSTRRKLMAAAITAALSVSASAGETIEYDNGLKIDWTAQVGYTAAWRMKDPSSKLTGAANKTGDDGNLNFKNGAMVNNKVNVLAEANFQMDKSGFFIRGSSFYDDVYHQNNDHPVAGPFGATTINTLQQPANRFTEEAKYYSGGYSKLLDAYAYTTLALGDESSLAMRLGRHVVSWGEVFYFSTMSGAQGAVDVTKSLTPGTETKDILLPVNQFSMNLLLNQDLSLMGYYQFESRKNDLPAVGTYGWTTDAFGTGAGCLAVMNIPGPTCVFGQRTPDEKARNGGQWGIGARYRITDSNEIGLYHFNYHDRNGQPVYTVTSIAPSFGATWRTKYFEDIKVTGATYATRLGNWQVSAEAAYKDGVPVGVKTGAFPTPSRANATQYTLSGYNLIGNNFLADGATVIAEITGSHIGHVEATTLASSGAAAGTIPFLPAAACPALGVCGSYTTLSSGNSRTAAAAVLSVTLNYKGVFPGWDIDVPITWQQGLSGVNTGFGLDSHADKKLTVGLDSKYLGNLALGLKYIAYLGSANPGGPDQVKAADRDFLVATAKYNF